MKINIYVGHILTIGICSCVVVKVADDGSSDDGHLVAEGRCPVECRQFDSLPASVDLNHGSLVGTQQFSAHLYTVTGQLSQRILDECLGGVKDIHEEGIGGTDVGHNVLGDLGDSRTGTTRGGG